MVILRIEINIVERAGVFMNNEETRQGDIFMIKKDREIER